MLWLVGITVALAVAYVLATQWGRLPRSDVIATGTVETRDGKVLNTRQYLRSSRKRPHKTPGPGALQQEAVWEVQLPSGRWVECEGEDCLGAYEKTLH